MKKLSQPVRWLCAAFALFVAAPVVAQDHLLATDQASGTVVYASVSGSYVQFLSIGPANILVSFDFDINNNGRADERVDVAFGQLSDGVICPQYRLSENSWTGCGGFKSAATLTQQNLGPAVSRRFSIPVAELSSDRKRFGYRLSFWDRNTKSQRRLSGVFDLASGPVANRPAIAPPSTGRLPAPPVTNKPITPSLPVSAPDQCGSKWRVINDSIAGASYQMAGEPKRNYFISWGDKLPSTTNDYMPPVLQKPDCSSFSVTVWDLGGKHVANPQGFFDVHQIGSIKGLTNGRIIYSRARQVDGFPAREYQYSFNIDFFGTPASHRVLLVSRNNQMLIFSWSWSAFGKPPADSDRAFNSIRVSATGGDEHIRTYALLREAITKYWMFPSKSYKYGDYFSPTLNAALDLRRPADTKVIESFGYPREMSVVRRNGTTKVVRIRHDSAVVEWTVVDNGTVLTAISWRKV